jgi:hypothetical protein
MVKIISRGSLPPDDPIFNGGVEMFSIRRPKSPAEEAPKDTDDENPPQEE